MTLKDIALLNLRRRKAKAAFVLAGLLIGVATMVALVGLAEALTHEINHKLEKYGANILVVPRSDQLALSYEGVNLGGFSFETKELKESRTWKPLATSRIPATWPPWGPWCWAWSR